MRTVRSTTLHLVPVLVAFACGGRSALDDAGFPVDDGDGVSASGGRSAGGGRPNFGSGGRSNFGSGGAFTTGGRPDSGDGGVFAAGGASSCPVGSWRDGDHCQDWTNCEPGKYTVIPGTSTTDAVCAPCPTDSYSAAEDQASCDYSGCAFSELVVTPATPTSPASCAPDPYYVDLGQYQYLVGLSHRGARAYVAQSGYGQTKLQGFDQGMLADLQIITGEDNKSVSAFALAPDDTTYLQGWSRSVYPPYTIFTPWLGAYASDGSPLWQSTIGPDASGGYNSGIVATDTHWISWQASQNGGPVELHLASAPHDNSTPSTTLNVKHIQTVFSLVADDQETVWLTGLRDSEMFLGRIKGASDSFEVIDDFSESSYANLVTVTPSGTVYLINSDQLPPGSFQIFELDSGAELRGKWAYTAQPGTSLNPIAIGVDPENAVYVSFNAASQNAVDFAISNNNVFMLRLDLRTGETTTKSFVGPQDDAVSFMTVTTDGSVYIAGVSTTQYSGYFFRKVY